MWDWLVRNRAWVFSGIGVSVLGSIGLLLRWFFTRRSKDPGIVQTQKAGDRSTNIWTGNGGTVINTTQMMIVSPEDAKQLTREGINEMLSGLAGEAREVFRQRAQQVADRAIEEMRLEDPKVLAKFSEPGFLCDAIEVEREFGKSGDKDMMEMLIAILTERALKQERSFEQIVLSEAIKTMPKLTADQCDTLSLLVQKLVTWPDVADLVSLTERLKKSVLPFLPGVRQTQASFLHLCYAGCCSSQKMLNSTLLQIMANRYAGLFSQGFTEELFARRSLPPSVRTLIIPCINDPTRLQWNAINRDVLVREAKGIEGISQSEIESILYLHKKEEMGVPEIGKRIADVVPELTEFFRAEEGMLRTLSITSVGVVIGVANYRRKVGEEIRLDEWLSEFGASQAVAPPGNAE